MFDTLILPSLFKTLEVGSMYALMALGITLTVSVLKLPNFAHAEYITVGAYTALIVSLNWSTNPVLVIGLAFVVTAVVAYASHRAVFKPMSKSASSIYTMLLASFAVGLILRYILFIIVDLYDLADRQVQVPQRLVMRVNDVAITNRFFWALLGGVGFVIALSLLLNYTPLGREMRALANNFDLARVIGIRVDRVQGMTWLLVGGLAGVSGALWGLSTSVNPLTGWIVILSVFAAAILGGLSSFPGTIMGAYVVSFSENTVMQLLNHYFGLGFNFKPAVPFVIIVIVLLIRPQGLTELLPTQRGLTR